jgi:AraC family transcriptional regulator
MDLTKPALPEFRVHDTGLDIFRDDLTIVKASDGLGWSSVHALVAQQAQNGKIPYEHIHKATADMWLAAAFDEISIVRTVSGVDHREKQPANITSITGAGVECRDLLYSPTTALHVYVKADVITEVADALFRGNREFAVASVLAAEDPVLRAMLQAIRDALFEPAQTSGLKVDYLARAIAAQVLQLHSVQTHQAVRPVVASGLGKRQLNLVSNYIDENLSTPIAVGDLAAITDLSPTHFMRQFKAATNVTPHQYVLHARIREAKGMLANSTLDLSAIALSCGFGDQAHFSSTFKRYTGMSPLRYRRETL